MGWLTLLAPGRGSPSLCLDKFDCSVRNKASPFANGEPFLGNGE